MSITQRREAVTGTCAAGQGSKQVIKVICYFKFLKNFFNGGVDSCHQARVEQLQHFKPLCFNKVFKKLREILYFFYI